MMRVQHISDDEPCDKDVVVVTVSEIIDAFKRWGEPIPSDAAYNFVWLLEDKAAELPEHNPKRI